MNRRNQIATIAQLKLPLYVASLWLALATALLSSLIPAGLPRTTVLGSAFNPATTAVALQPTRAQPRILAENVRRDDNPASGQGGAIQILSIPALPAVRPDAIAAVPKPATVASPIVSHAVVDGSPRGPPLT
ncbi:hypothetical protein OK349_01080 [Sphingomonas sp. BT-65]|uniref:hypothetical protein n=1 Tax=Sphingomonas sp. BT-65 TaxID=2989821 RepID=UPI002236485B|nr:hypothetical protein [Sphingomonas sp. BT-65]MCW4460285.1 hypothetical protein [Sphingomonas sp. BT-65]